MNQLLYVYNPKAGKGMLEAELPNIISTFTKAGFDVLTHATTSKGEGYRFTLEYLKNRTLPDRIVCGGGDGTLQEIVRAVKESGKNVPVGIIPSGSTNDFGYSLGLEKNIASAAGIASSGKKYECDIATFNGRYFVYTAAFGLFSEVSYATPQKLKNTLGHAAYILYGAATLLKNRRIHAKIEYTDNDNEKKEIEEDLLLGMVVSAKSVGGFRGITGKKVRMNDGLDEIMLVLWPKNPVQLIKAVLEALTHKNDGKYFKIIKASNVKFKFNKRVKWSVDGEYGGVGRTTTINVEQQGMTYIRK